MVDLSVNGHILFQDMYDDDDDVQRKIKKTHRTQVRAGQKLHWSQWVFKNNMKVFILLYSFLCCSATKLQTKVCGSPDEIQSHWWGLFSALTIFMWCMLYVKELLLIGLCAAGSGIRPSGSESGDWGGPGSSVWQSGDLQPERQRTWAGRQRQHPEHSQTQTEVRSASSWCSSPISEVHSPGGHIYIVLVRRVMWRSKTLFFTMRK